MASSVYKYSSCRSAVYTACVMLSADSTRRESHAAAQDVFQPVLTPKNQAEDSTRQANLETACSRPSPNNGTRSPTGHYSCLMMMMKMSNINVISSSIQSINQSINQSIVFYFTTITYTTRHCNKQYYRVVEDTLVICIFTQPPTVLTMVWRCQCCGLTATVCWVMDLQCFHLYLLCGLFYFLLRRH